MQRKHLKEEFRFFDLFSSLFVFDKSSIQWMQALTQVVKWGKPWLDNRPVMILRCLRNTRHKSMQFQVNEICLRSVWTWAWGLNNKHEINQWTVFFWFMTNKPVCIALAKHILRNTIAVGKATALQELWDYLEYLFYTIRK